MSRSGIVALLLVASAGAPLHATAQDQASKPNIEQQLKTQYHLTRVGSNGVVVQAGSVLVVQQDNIKANPASNQLYWSNLYKKDARVKQPAFMVKSGSAAVDKSTIRFLQVGEKVYVNSIDIKPTDIVFSLQTCGACDPSAVDPNDAPYRAELSFQFQKGFVDSANFKEIVDTIGQVLAIAPPGTGSAGSSAPDASQSGSNASDAAPAPIPPPPLPSDEPPPAPKTIALDQTTDQVIANFGQPEKIAKLGTKEIYYYKDFKVTFVGGKVTDVQ